MNLGLIHDEMFTFWISCIMLSVLDGSGLSPGCEQHCERPLHIPPDWIVFVNDKQLEGYVLVWSHRQTLCLDNSPNGRTQTL